MGRYNEFMTTVMCPHCRKNVVVLFQADIGPLEWRVFEIGEQVVDLKSELKIPTYGGPTDTSIDFWAYGLDSCPDCKKDIWAKVNVRSKRFESVTIVEEAPENIYGWGILSDDTGT